MSLVLRSLLQYRVSHNSQSSKSQGYHSFKEGFGHLYLPAFGLVISQLGDKVLTVLFQKAVLHLCINHLICRLEDLVHRPRSVLVVQDVVDAILAAPHHVLQALPLHHCLAGQDGEEAGGPSPWVFIQRGQMDHITVSHVDGPVLVASVENLNQVSRLRF